MIGFCEHGLPHTHTPRRSYGTPQHDVCFPTHGPGFKEQDPVVKYIQLAEEANAILEAAHDVTRGKTVPYERWSVILRLSGHPPPLRPLPTPWQIRHTNGEMEPLELDPHQEQAALQAAVQAWLDIGDVRLTVIRFDPISPTLTFGGGTLFGALAHMLAISAFRLAGSYMCDGCGRMYSPLHRKPRRGSRKFCSECQQEGVPARLRQQRLREQRQTSGNPDGVK
jgi:hypothetical protein